MANPKGCTTLSTGRFNTRKELTDTIWQMKSMGKKTYDISIYCKVSTTLVDNVVRNKEGMPEMVTEA